MTTDVPQHAQVSIVNGGFLVSLLWIEQLDEHNFGVRRTLHMANSIDECLGLIRRHCEMLQAAEQGNFETEHAGAELPDESKTPGG